ncbi:MAG: putative baseplate assembly protein [Verrucomicrobiales bacterium]|nr:putative baseplate assembly protein [Verrucomicrobiales bacterium]
MPLTSPNLDDRTFQQLLDECHARVRGQKRDWDASPGNPGEVLLELFSHLTEVMIYRLNRLPQKAYVEFLRLIGVRLLPPTAASAELRFTLQRPQPQPVEIRQGTRVTLGRAGGEKEPPIFTTARALKIAPGQTEGSVLAYHCELVEAELAGQGTGLPGQFVVAKRPPIVALLEDHFDVRVGVEASDVELDPRPVAVDHQGKAYRIWREVEDFVDLGPDRFVYVVDRITGVITFAPALYQRGKDGKLDATAETLAEVPAAGREVRLWYCRGGGPSGNVAAHMLKVLKDSLPGVEVTNPEPAKGGMSAESLENALLRGPQELHSLHRAVTARDFELLALRHPGLVARAKAYTKAALWKHAAPGTVEVLLVPSVPEALRQAGRITPAQIKEQQTETARQRVQAALDERRPLGTTCLVDWVRYKTVRVRARIVLHREEDELAVKQRVLQQLHKTINPLPSSEPGATGWRFGQSLRASNVYDIILAEPGVNYIDQVRLLVDEVPDKDAVSVVADAFQLSAWHAAAGDTVYRSTNDGVGWEATELFADEKLKLIKPHPARAGLLALTTELKGDTAGHRVHVSLDCGENWRMAAQTNFSIDDMVWLPHKDEPTLLLATDAGLYELAAQPGAVPVQVIVDPQNQQLGFYAVAVTDVRGSINIAVAARDGGGIFLSEAEGQEAFKEIGLKGEGVRVLEVQNVGPRRFLWAGVTTPGFEAGRGCFRFELTSADVGWSHFNNRWQGGSCLRLAFLGKQVFAATHHAGVLRTDYTRGGPNAVWQGAAVKCGLPMRDVEKFQRVSSLAVNQKGEWLLACGPEGVFRSRDAGVKFEFCSNREFVDQVTLPETALFCSGEHDVST